MLFIQIIVPRKPACVGAACRGLAALLGQHGIVGEGNGRAGGGVAQMAAGPAGVKTCCFHVVLPFGMLQVLPKKNRPGRMPRTACKYGAYCGLLTFLRKVGDDGGNDGDQVIYEAFARFISSLGVCIR